MLKEKESLLKEKIKNIIEEIGHMSDIKQEVGKEFKLRNLAAHRAVTFFMNPDYIYTLSDSDEDLRFLFLFAYLLNKALKEKGLDLEINVENYFTKVEYNQWINYREEIKQENIYPIILENVDQIADSYWQTIMSAQTIEKLNAANILFWNPNTQRGFKVTKTGLRVNVNPAKTKEIKECMLSGKQFADDLKFNIVKTGEEKPPAFNSKKKTLTIYEGSIINTFDGQHRKEANALAIQENPDLIFNWPVKITYFSEIKAHDFMVQINKQTPIDEEVISSRDYSKNENLVVDKIMDSKGELASVTSETIDYIKNNRGLVSKSILADAIADNYNGQLEIGMDRDNVADWIVEFTNYLMGYYRDEFIIKPYEIKKSSYINNRNMFYGYVALSAKLRDNIVWKEMLKQKIDSLDFSINNPLWREIGLIGEKQINKTTKNKLYDLFREV